MDHRDRCCIAAGRAPEDTGQHVDAGQQFDAALVVVGLDAAALDVVKALGAIRLAAEPEMNR
jgi:hypothetical protein